MPYGLCATLPVVRTKSKHQTLQNEEKKKKLIRPSELPIYATEKPIIVKNLCINEDYGHSYIEEGLNALRENVADFYCNLVQYKYSVKPSFFEKSSGSRDYNAELLQYLQEESNLLPRTGAVGVGGLSGLILGLRGGNFKKLFFFTTGVMIAAAVCYPMETREGIKRCAERTFNVVKASEKDSGKRHTILFAENIEHFPPNETLRRISWINPYGPGFSEDDDE